MVWSTAPPHPWGSVSSCILRAFSSQAQSGGQQEPVTGHRGLCDKRVFPLGDTAVVMLSWSPGCGPICMVRDKAGHGQLRFSEWREPACSLTWHPKTVCHFKDRWLLSAVPLSPLCHQHCSPSSLSPQCSPQIITSLLQVGAALSSLVVWNLAQFVFFLNYWGALSQCCHKPPAVI